MDEGKTGKDQREAGITNNKRQEENMTLGLLDSGKTEDLDNNFSASANGTSKPAKNGLFGPFRSIM